MVFLSILSLIHSVCCHNGVTEFKDEQLDQKMLHIEIKELIEQGSGDLVVKATAFQTRGHQFKPYFGH